MNASKMNLVFFKVGGGGELRSKEKEMSKVAGNPVGPCR